MADHAVENNDIFVYRGGRAPQHITHARIDDSVEEIEDRAFYWCINLVHVETHNRIRKIGEYAFFGCENLPRIDIRSVVEIDLAGFYGCEKLQFVEFGDKLESIGRTAFYMCPIEHLKLPSVVSVGQRAFAYCERLVDVEFSTKLVRVSLVAFEMCDHFQRIVIPLKRNLFSDDHVFERCDQFSRVDLVGGVHQTISSLHMESWREEMNTEINRINQILPYTHPQENKTQIITEWINSVIDRLDHYKTEHCSYVKEAATLLELALWKAKLDERATKKLEVESDDVRLESRVTCGADTVIKNVLPFLRFR